MASNPSNIQSLRRSQRQAKPVKPYSPSLLQKVKKMLTPNRNKNQPSSGRNMMTEKCDYSLSDSQIMEAAHIPEFGDTITDSVIMKAVGTSVSSKNQSKGDYSLSDSELVNAAHIPDFTGSVSNSVIMKAVEENDTSVVSEITEESQQDEGDSISIVQDDTLKNSEAGPITSTPQLDSQFTIRSLESLLKSPEKKEDSLEELQEKSSDCIYVSFHEGAAGLQTLLSDTPTPHVSDETMAALKSQQSQTPKAGIRTLLSESAVDDIPNTQPEFKVNLLQQRLFSTTNDLQKITRENEALRNQLDEKEKEIDKLRSDLRKAKENQVKNHAQKKIINKVDDQQKELTRKNDEIHKLTEEIQLRNRFSPLSEEATPDTPYSNHTNSGQTTEEVLYFRGWWDPLSPFHQGSSWLKNDEGRTFKTVEHLYQYEKAVYHNNIPAAKEIRFAKTPGEAKRIANRYFKNKCKPGWHEIKVTKMRQIVQNKVNVCPEFKNALLNTGTKMLIHNMEEDPEWGFGRDGKGKNLMGKILESVRETARCESHQARPDQSEPSRRSHVAATPTQQNGNEGTRRKSFAEAASVMPSDQPSDATQDGASVKVPKSTKLFVVGNSNARDISNHLQELGAQTSSAVFSGAPSWFIRSRLDHSKPSSPPTHVFVHSGDIDVRR